MNLDDFKTSGLTADTSLSAAQYGKPTTRPGRIELEVFITATRRELHALSAALEHAVDTQPADAALAPLPSHEPAAPANAPLPSSIQSTETTSDPTEPSAPPASNWQSALQPQQETVPAPQAMQGKTAEAVDPPADDADPLARLHAIKQRLAQQLENTL